MMGDPESIGARIGELIDDLRHWPHHHPIVIGRFEGAHFIHPKTGVLTVAAQPVPASTALTGGLIFTDSTGAVVKGPIGALTADQTTVTPTLSADGQSYNFTSPASGSVTLTWTDPAGVVAPFSQIFTDQVIAVTVTGAFGPAAPGTTA